MLRKLKEKYWDFANRREMESRMALPQNQAFAAHVRNERDLVMAAANGQVEDPQQRLEAAVDWLLQAQSRTPDGGVSQGYFPITTEEGWKASYPETTGYIITTLLRIARRDQREDLAEAALRMADWEIDVQMSSGAVQGGVVCPPEQQSAAAFNTGMVVDGWVSAWEHSGEDRHLQAALRGARFLAADLNDEGFFRTNGDYVHGDAVKTYTCLCAWAMYRAGNAADDDALRSAAVRSIEAALRQREDNGWFRNNCLNLSHIPLTHTIGYALQGIFEVGVLAGRADFIDAVRHTLDGALSSLQDNGYLAARLDCNWQPQAEHVCLTGSVQLAIICFRLAEEFGEEQFVDAGTRLLGFVKATQLMACDNESMVGAIPGSFPLLGEYMMAGYPNWATKYYIDALMLKQALDQR